MSQPVLGFSWWNARTLPSGRQERAYFSLLLSARRWASPEPSARIHQRSCKPTKERDSIRVTVRLSPEVYDGMKQLQNRTGARLRRLRSS